MNSIVENVVIGDQEIHINGGAYSFIDEIIRDKAGEDAATFCSSGFKTEFNKECQSLAVITNDRQKYQRVENRKSLQV
ncbi:MAG: hypothetical protein M3139_11995 [Bacteroidota bacterium]|nr:hypothetical protein [Bacteroidota bacterium]